MPDVEICMRWYPYIQSKVCVNLKGGLKIIINLNSLDFSNDMISLSTSALLIDQWKNMSKYVIFKGTTTLFKNT